MSGAQHALSLAVCVLLTHHSASCEHPHRLSEQDSHSRLLAPLAWDMLSRPISVAERTHRWSTRKTAHSRETSQTATSTSGFSRE